MGNQLYEIPQENTFEHSATTNQELSLVNNMRRTLYQPKWSIDFMNYVDSQWKKVIPLIRRTQNRELVVSNVKIPDVLSKIVHIQFTGLRVLILRYNFIVSIEAISKLNAPQLQRLQIASNRIINLRSLRKMWCPSLTQLILIQNIINDSNALTELNCHHQFDSLEMFAPSKRVLPQNINWVVKMKIQKIRIIEYYDTNIIRNNKMREMIKQRYVGCNVVMRYDVLQ